MFKLNYKSFVLLPACILCIIAPFIHRAGFNGTEYYAASALWIPIITTTVALLLSVPPIIDRYSPLLMFFATFTSLLAFVKVSYLYLSSVFFSGIADTLGGMLEQIGFYWSFCAFAYLGAMIISIVAFFLPDFEF